MARVQRNVVIEGLSGKLGDQLVFRRLRDGRTIVCAKPDFSNRALSANQKAHHAKFKEAAAYARHAARTEPLYAQLAAGTMKTAYNIALADFFHPPVIEKVERKEDRIRVRARDDVRVVSVKVTITNEAGEVLEQGEAMQGKSDLWEYEAQNEGRAVVEARDLAGNVTNTELREYQPDLPL